MQEFVTVAKIPYLLRPDLREFKHVPYHKCLTVQEAVGSYFDDLEKLGFREYVITKEGYQVENLNALTKPGDFIAVSVRHGIEVTAVFLAMGVTMTAATGATIAGIVNTAILVGIGFLVQTFMPKPTPKNAPNDSPTYSIDPANRMTEGQPLPVVYGYVATYPSIIASYRRVASDYNMWSHILYALQTGPTTHTLYTDSVYLNDEVITSYSDYYWYTTSGHWDLYGQFSVPDGDVSSLQGTVNNSVSDEFFPYAYQDRAFDHIITKGSKPTYSGTVATNVLTGSTSTPEAGSTVAITDSDGNTETWTFQLAARSNPYEVQIGGDTDTAMTNLASAIYTDSAKVTASYSSYVVTISLRLQGIFGNSYTLAASVDTYFTANSSYFYNGVDPHFISGTNIFSARTNSKCDSVILFVEFPYGKLYMDDNGDPINYVISFEYGYKTPDQTEDSITWVPWTPSGKGTQAVRVETTITLPTRDIYDIYLLRVSDDDASDDLKRHSTSVVTGLVERISLFQQFPGIRCGVLSLKSSEKIGRTVPTLKVVQNTTSINVRNWADTGAMTVNCTNPAWAAYDAFTNPYTGRNISPTKLNQSAWEDWVAYCDEVVWSDYKRAQINIVFDESGPFGDACLKHIEDVGRAKVVQFGSTWTVIIDKPRGSRSSAGTDTIDVSYLFSAGNIVPGTFEWQGFEDSEKVDAIELSYWDKDHGFKKKSVLQKASWYETLDKEPNVAQIEIRGCNNREQAKREALFRMQKTEYITRHGSLQTTIAAMAVERGDVVAIIHPTNRYGFSGRLTQDHTSATTIYIDQWINMTANDYSARAKLFIVDPNGVEYQFDVDGPFGTNTNYITISSGQYWDNDSQTWVSVSSYTGYKFDTFAIGRPNDEKLYYQIMNKRIIQATDTRQATMEFEFVEYNPNVFYNIAYGTNPI